MKNLGTRPFFCGFVTMTNNLQPSTVTLSFPTMAVNTHSHLTPQVLLSFALSSAPFMAKTLNIPSMHFHIMLN
jgi:hypothetical protein